MPDFDTVCSVYLIRIMSCVTSRDDQVIDLMDDIVTDHIQLRIAVTVYHCLHGTTPDYLSELLVPASTIGRLVTVSDPLTATSSSFRQSNCLHMDGVLLVFQAQLFGTACWIILETTHYPMIRSGAISNLSFCTLLINLLRLSALETL